MSTKDSKTEQMKNEEFLRDVCPNHTDKSQWNKSELLHILELHKQQLRLHIVNQCNELLPNFLYKDDGIKIGYHGDTEVSKEWNDYLKKLANCE